jgi:hypothetical protein
MANNQFSPDLLCFEAPAEAIHTRSDSLLLSISWLNTEGKKLVRFDRNRQDISTTVLSDIPVRLHLKALLWLPATSRITVAGGCSSR